MSGPFGQYEGNSVGRFLNDIVRIERMPLFRAENIYFEESNVKENGDVLGRYRWFPEIDRVLFSWRHDLPFGRPKLVANNGKLVPTFGLSLSPSEMVAFQARLETKYMMQLHHFVRRMLTNYMDDPCYKLHQEAGAFFQSGSHDEKADYILIEFWKPQGAQAFVDYLNANLVFDL